MKTTIFGELSFLKKSCLSSLFRTILKPLLNLISLDMKRSYSICGKAIKSMSSLLCEFKKREFVFEGKKCIKIGIEKPNFAWNLIRQN